MPKLESYKRRLTQNSDANTYTRHVIAFLNQNSTVQEVDKTLTFKNQEEKKVLILQRILVHIPKPKSF